MSKRNLLAALLVVAALGGIAAGIALTRGGTENALAQGPPGVIGQGSFRSVHAGTAGTVRLVRSASGKLTLRLSPDFRTQNAPELYVYLVRGGQHREVASLRSWQGAQSYAVPADAKGLLSSSVEIVCGKCNATYGVARLQGTPRPQA